MATIQTDTTVLYLVICPEPESGQIHFGVVKGFDLHKLQLTQKEYLLERKCLTVLQHALAYPQPQS